VDTIISRFRTAKPAVTLTENETAANPNEGVWLVVLGRTPRGDNETQRPLFPLSQAQRDLLGALDGRRSLLQLTTAKPTLRSARLARDAARLLAFGLVKQLRGELPRDIVVSSMNLTMRVPISAFRSLAPDQPQPAATATTAVASGATAVRGTWVAALLALAVAAVAAGWLVR
jgi:hypothetical protein